MSLMRGSRDTTSNGRHGVTAAEGRDPIGFAVAVINRLAQSGALDRFGLRKPTERVVFVTGPLAVAAGGA